MQDPFQNSSWLQTTPPARPCQVTPSAPCAVINANSTINTGDTFYANALDTVCNGDACDYHSTVGAGGCAAAHRAFAYQAAAGMLTLAY